MGVDICGTDVVGSGQVFETGDKDGICVPTGRQPVPIASDHGDSALILASLHTDLETPYAADPRNALKSVLDRYAKAGLTPVCASELEFFVYDLDASSSEMAVAPQVGGRGQTSAIYAVSELDEFGPFLTDLYAACEKAGIPAESAIAESGCGQFEVNFHHVRDALRAADDAQLFKHLAKLTARKHGFGATFMAKPFGEDSGSGLHIHFSLLDSEGVNVFDDGTPQGSKTLLSAVAGLLAAMPDHTAIFAPHYNSFRRLRAETHAPISIAWAYENRTAAIRIPDSQNADRRIEHRVAGADANPYLVLAAVLGAALVGIETQMEPPAPLEGSSYDQQLPAIPTNWQAALQHFRESELNRRIFGELLCTMYLACKEQELEVLANQVSPIEYDLYLDRV
nr:glutamine synthetase family protein [Pacificimonas pallii]